MKKTRYTRLFKKKVMAEIPVFYNFLQKSTKAETDRIEFRDYKVSTSKKHRSISYEVHDSYKPETKFNFLKQLIK